MSTTPIVSIQVKQEMSLSMHDHTAAHEGIGDFLIVAISVIVVVLALFLCVKYLLFPKEKEVTHIKNRILDDEVRHDGELRHEQ